MADPQVGDAKGSHRRSWKRILPAWLRHGAVIFVVLAVIEYLVVPERVGAGKDLDLLRKLNLGWLACGTLLECGSILC